MLLKLQCLLAWDGRFMLMTSAWGRLCSTSCLLCAGVGNVLGNKGGVGVTLTYMNHTRLLFVNAHFAAHDHKVAQRQADYLRIKAGLFNTKEEPGILPPPCFSISPRYLDLQKCTASSSSVFSQKHVQHCFSARVRRRSSLLLQRITFLGKHFISQILNPHVPLLPESLHTLTDVRALGPLCSTTSSPAQSSIQWTPAHLCPRLVCLLLGIVGTQCYTCLTVHASYAHATRPGLPSACPWPSSCGYHHSAAAW